MTLVHLMDRLLERQLDAPAAALLKRALEARGIEVLLNAATTRFIGDSHVEGVELKDGRLLAADTVVAAVGIKPNAEVAARAEEIAGRENVNAGDFEIGGVDAAEIARVAAGEALGQHPRLLVGGLDQP